MSNQCCSSDFSFTFIQLITYNHMLWLHCAHCGLCLSHPPCHGPFSWIPSKLWLQYRLGDPAPLLSWRGRGVRDRHSRNRSGLLMSGCLIIAGRWLREEDGSPFRSGAVSLLSEERQMLSQMLQLPPFPSPVSCGRILCLSFGSELKTSPYSWSFDELCSQWVLTEKSMQSGWVTDCQPDPILPGVSWTSWEILSLCSHILEGSLSNAYFVFNFFILFYF